MLLEEAGVPSVAVHTHVFTRLVRETARANGMPRTRQAFVPQPVVDLSRPQLRAYIEGKDPISDRPFMQEVIEGLTRPLDAGDLTVREWCEKPHFEIGTTPRIGITQCADWPLRFVWANHPCLSRRNA